MSKSGMRPIRIAKAKVSVDDTGLVRIAGDKITTEHQMPGSLVAILEEGKLKVSLVDKGSVRAKGQKALWGLHRALLANKVKGVEDGFVSTVRIVGIGYKALLQGSSLVLNLGYSHKIELPLDNDVAIEVDKTGQLLTLRSSDRFRLGNYCAQIRSFRVPEPYKGTGIFVNGEAVIRKAGKSKA